MQPLELNHVYVLDRPAVIALGIVLRRKGLYADICKYIMQLCIESIWAGDLYGIDSANLYKISAATFRVKPRFYDGSYIEFGFREARIVRRDVFSCAFDIDGSFSYISHWPPIDEKINRIVLEIDHIPEIILYAGESVISFCSVGFMRS